MKRSENETEYFKFIASRLNDGSLSKAFLNLTCDLSNFNINSYVS